jgi:hypothetical protein
MKTEEPVACAIPLSMPTPAEKVADAGTLRGELYALPFDAFGPEHL